MDGNPKKRIMIDTRYMIVRGYDLAHVNQPENTSNTTFAVFCGMMQAKMQVRHPFTGAGEHLKSQDYTNLVNSTSFEYRTLSRRSSKTFKRPEGL